MKKLTEEQKTEMRESFLAYTQGVLEGLAGSAVASMTAIVCKGYGLPSAWQNVIGGIAGVATILVTDWAFRETDQQACDLMRKRYWENVEKQIRNNKDN